MLPECLKDLQPPEMIEWEREREKMEFERASKLYKPMSNILASRFTSAKSHDISHLRKCFLIASIIIYIYLLLVSEGLFTV